MKYAGSNEAAAQRVKRNIARAKGSIRKKEYLKAIKEAKLAFEARPDCNGLYGQQRVEIDFMLEDFCNTFSANKGILELLDRFRIRHKPFIAYNRGAVTEIVTKLDILSTRLADHLAEGEKRLQAQHERDKKYWITKGRHCLQRGELPLGRSHLRRAAEEFGNEQGVLTEIAEMLLEKDLLSDAAELLAQARELFPSDQRAYTLGVRAHMTQAEWDKAEEIYLQALKVFGNHAITLLNLARLYMKWNKRDKAWEYARMALEKNPNLEEAQEIMNKAG
ncbi:hypothetical protein [Desulfovibrio ferrophilus]|uniref:Uncharacterized protein n=1 Tax=Desulfovibrio ferrophilus TaxID=241368 RepID=A0A2Z6AVM0_9BACT|nr:hypothetical protein [Desulfovibrio ferrophilus]BBD07263.1 uncharacterized protein DFE_0537 [Desulfovibrio ferrophilus]